MSNLYKKEYHSKSMQYRLKHELNTLTNIEIFDKPIRFNNWNTTEGCINCSIEPHVCYNCSIINNKHKRIVVNICDNCGWYIKNNVKLHKDARINNILQYILILNCLVIRDIATIIISMYLEENIS